MVPKTAHTFRDHAPTSWRPKGDRDDRTHGTHRLRARPRCPARPVLGPVPAVGPPDHAPVKAPDYDGALDYFPIAFHEPYYADYVREDPTALFGDAGFALEETVPAYFSKVLVLRKA